MDYVYPLKYPSYSSITCSENFKFSPNYINISIPKIISYLPLAEQFYFSMVIHKFIEDDLYLNELELCLLWSIYFLTSNVN